MQRQLFFSPANAPAVLAPLASGLIFNRRYKLLLPYVPEPDATEDINLNHSRSAGITTASGSSASPAGLIVPASFGESRDNGKIIA
ncbi:MAG: hypothetical protein ABSG35_21590 [Syntrophobacteraceae bacterium]